MESKFDPKQVQYYAVHEVEFMGPEMAEGEGYELAVKASDYDALLKSYTEALAEIDDRGLEIDHWKKEAEAFSQTARTLKEERKRERTEHQRELNDAARSAADERTWREIQGDDYGSY